MRLKNVPGAREAVAVSPLVLHSKEETDEYLAERGEHPLYLEIGMGKGKFIIESALKHPEITWLGIEMYESVMIRAIEKLEKMKRAEEEGVPGIRYPDNLNLIRMDANEIRSRFAPSSVDRIYLNFSDPWPKVRHAKRRLTSGRFLNIFREILKEHACIEFKTDNRSLFDFSLLEYEKAGYELLYCSYDLHADAEAMKDNIMTEYEEKFSSAGNPICKYIIRRL